MTEGIRKKADLLVRELECTMVPIKMSSSTRIWGKFAFRGKLFSVRDQTG